MRCSASASDTDPDTTYLVPTFIPSTHEDVAMRRRQFITSASATVAAASMAGCSGILGGGGGSSGPAAPVKTYLKAGVEGDQKKIQKALHPDASQEMTTAAGFLSMADSIKHQEHEGRREIRRRGLRRSDLRDHGDGRDQLQHGDFLRSEAQGRLEGVRRRVTARSVRFAVRSQLPDGSEWSLQGRGRSADATLAPTPS